MSLEKKLVQPLPVRIFHWLTATIVFTLVLTGLYINNPTFLDLPLWWVRKVHFYFSFLFIANFTLYTYYYAITRKYPEVLFMPGDIKKMPRLLAFEFFLENTQPNFGRYNPGQKLLFTAWFLLALVLICDGLVLYFINLAQNIFYPLALVNTLRMIIYFGTVFFAISIPVHIYLAVTSDPAKVQAMVTGYIEQNKP
ncbi:MAG: cytochrome b/b6 domain-containing protein [Thermoanaerobacteraceae bacterium]|nr:cytochrome b/b6 domain-containing protein [Thermoanaerobacteraceae bacterium]